MRSVLLLTIDCLRADHVGCYGYDPPTTPNIDALATEGTVFEHAYANCPGTRWAFQSLHTGLWTSQIDGLGIPVDYGGVLAKHFTQAGYKTAGFSKNGFVSSDYGYDTGFDRFVDIHDLTGEEHAIRRIGRQIDRIFDSQLLRDRVLRRIRNLFESLRHAMTAGGFTPDIPDSVVTDAALEWLDNRQRDEQPYFAWLHFMNVHTPYGRWPNHLAAVRGDNLVEHTIHPGDEGLIQPGRNPPRRVLAAYDANIRSVDEQVGRILEVVDEETAIVVTGDHGEEFGRKKPFHKESFYKQFVHVPLIVRLPDVGPGRRTDPVQHLDIPPTLTAAAGTDAPPQWQGSPLQRTHRETDDPIYFDLDRDRRGVHKGSWKLICGEGNPELYRVCHGEFETDTVNDEYPEQLQELSLLLEEFERQLTDCRLTGHIEGSDGHYKAAENLSETVRENLEDLGYVE